MRRVPWFECAAFLFGVIYFFAMSEGRGMWISEDRASLFWIAPLWCGFTLAIACRGFKPWFRFSYGAAFFTGFLVTWLATPIAFAGALAFAAGWHVGGGGAGMGVLALIFIWWEPLHYILAPLLGIVLHWILQRFAVKSNPE